MTDFDSHPDIQTTIPRSHWIALACAVLATVLVLLVIGWSGALQTSLNENRALASRPARPHKFREFKAYPKAFDEYVHDQFPPRVALIAGLNYARFRFGYSGAAHVVVGKDGWLFHDHGNFLGYAGAVAPMSVPDLAAWADTYEDRLRALASRGIAYEVLIGPVKESVYPGKLPEWARGAGRVDDRSAIEAYLQRRGLQGLVDPWPDLSRAAAHGEEVFEPYETHWTGKGAYLAYRALVLRLSERFPALRPLPIEAFPRDIKTTQAGDVAHMLGIGGLVKTDFALLDTPPAPMPPRLEFLGPRTDGIAPRLVTTGFPGPRLLLIRDSFSSALIPMLAPHFSQIIAVQSENGWDRPDLVDRYHPDIVVLEVISSGARFAMNKGAAVPPAQVESKGPAAIAH